MLDIVEYGQEGHVGGHFEVLEQTPKKIKLKMGRYWRQWFDLYGDGFGMDDNGVIQGVSKDDLETYYGTWLEHFCAHNDWQYDIEDQGEAMRVVTVLAAE